MSELRFKEAKVVGKKNPKIDMSPKNVEAESRSVHSGPERFFECKKDEQFRPSEFTLMFMDSDSVTNVTALNRVNHRRVLLFIGNGNGFVSYGMGKGEDYERAFENAYKTLRKNLICLPMDPKFTSPVVMKARHNDYRITIFP